MRRVSPPFLNPDGMHPPVFEDEQSRHTQERRGRLKLLGDGTGPGLTSPTALWQRVVGTEDILTQQSRARLFKAGLAVVKVSEAGTCRAHTSALN